MLKKTVIVIVIVLAFLSIYFGSYLPVVKSQAYIRAIRLQVRTVDEFRRNFDKPLNFYSPIGQEEVVKFLSGNILGLISREGQPEAVNRELVAYIEPYIFKDNVRHLLTMSHIYDSLWRNYKQDTDFQKAESYYKQVLVIGPRLPHALYRLLELYRLQGDVRKMKEVGEVILKHWPTDERIKQILEL